MHKKKKNKWISRFLILDILLVGLIAAIDLQGERTGSSNLFSGIHHFFAQTKIDAERSFVPGSVPDSVRPIDAPFIRQNPQLPRGCEVTSLTMMLRQAGVNADKMELAQAIDKVPFRQAGQYGSPEKGFVGDMYNSNQPGYGVYHQPLTRLAEHYLPHRIVDLSGQPFSAVEKRLSKGKPVVVIINTTFHPLDANAFQTWQTQSGPLRVTYYEHAVLVTGYNQHEVYFNNPLGHKNQRADKAAFISAWMQMGRQAISYKNWPGF
ncbi:MAG: C39 family peptidase [Sporolactobacillus sp.]